MTVENVRRRFTVDEYHKMIDAGIFQEDDRIELLDGEIQNMSPIDAVHVAHVNRLTRLFVRMIDEQAIVSVQNPVELNDYSEPQPDIALLCWRDDFYETHLPTPADSLLFIEVANSTATTDRKEKLPRYADAGIPEVWIINIKQQIIEQYTQPDGKVYVNRKLIKRGVITTTTLLPAITVAVEQIFG